MRLVLFSILFAAVPALAQTLAPVPVSSGPSWLSALPWVLLVVGGIAGFIVFHRNSPTKAQKVDAALKEGWHQTLIRIADAADTLVKHRTGAEPPAAATAATAEPQAPAVVPGHSGQAGTFSFEVTGDPGTDLPAITAAYLKPPAP